MHRGLLLLCLVAACGGGEGIELDVRPGDARVTTVELLISLDQCTEPACNGGLAWGPQGAPPGRVNVLYRDPSIDADPAFIATVDKDGYARFRIQLAADQMKIARIGVLGYDAQQQPIAMEIMEDVAVPKHHAEYWHLDLDPVAGDATNDTMTPPATSSADHRAHVWRRAKPGQASCAALQEYDDAAHEWVSEYFAPEQDADCDGEEIECNPYWYDYNKGAPASPCVAPIGPGTACVVGLSQCADGTSADPACKLVTNPFCFPEQICHDCGTPATASCVKGSVQNAITNMTSMPRFNCLFSPDPTSGGTLPCISGTSIKRITLPVGNCGEAKLAPIGVGTFNPQSNVMLGNATFALHTASAADRCDIDISWTQGSNVGAPLAQDFLLLVSYGANTLLFPMRIGFEPADTCLATGSPPTLCESPQLDATGDTIWRCALP